MRQRLGGSAAREGRLFWLVSAFALAAACGKGEDVNDGAATGGGIFGGTGNVRPGLPLAGTGGSGVSSVAGTGGSSTDADECRHVPPGKVALLDDFDDGNNVAEPEAEREAYWFTIHDDTPGSIDPPKDFVPSPGGYLGTRSAHVVASGYTLWGAALVANISHKAALRCPYDASSFKGLRFVARGSGFVRVQVIMPGVTDKEFGGTCDPTKGEICYDNHGTFVELGTEYRVYELPWSSFQQRGYGTQVAFDEKTVTALQFAMEQVNLPVDLWVDQIEFWDGVPSAPSDGGAGGTGGGAQDAGGAESAGLGGSGGAGGAE
jgi:hypothetical protein